MLAAISRRWFVGGTAATPALAAFSAGCRAAPSGTSRPAGRANNRSSTVPKEISLSGLLKMGSHTVRIADSRSCQKRTGPPRASSTRETVTADFMVVCPWCVDRVEC